MSRYTYERTATTFDPSILGIYPDELKDMEPEERKEALYEHLMRASDVAEHTARAFKDDLSPSDHSAVMSAAKELSQLARRLHK